MFAGVDSLVVSEPVTFLAEDDNGPETYDLEYNRLRRQMHAKEAERLQAFRALKAKAVAGRSSRRKRRVR